MKDIRIFIASSKELVQERNELAFLVLAKEEEFTQRGLRVRLAKWEYVDPKMTTGRTEDRYLDEMYKCDAAMVIFKNIAGMYTREELDKALAREAAGTDRIKTHKILFSTEGKPDSDAAKLRASLPEGTYSVYTALEELKATFLSLVDEVSRSLDLVEAQDENLHEVSAFVAADDELASDRNAFADTILNLNDILVRRGIRVRMRFYDPEHHRELLESSEMALVLYDTNYKAFSPDRMQDAYERTKREENPKRLYVFFRDEEESKLDQAFVEFRNGFVENLGHFFCRFENADTLKLNFLLSLENVLGDGVEFVKLDGKKIKAGELEVAEITKLPMVANNGGLRELQEQYEEVEKRFNAQREACQSDPENSSLYSVLLKLSAKKRELKKKTDEELSRSFELAKRMAAISAKNASETVSRARELLDRGRIDEALEVLDGGKSEIDDLLGDIFEADDGLERKMDALEAWLDVEFFHIDTILAHTKLAFEERFEKAASIYRELLVKSEKMLEKYRPLLLAKTLLRFAGLYAKKRDTVSPVALLQRSIALYESQELIHPKSCREDLAKAYRTLGGKYRANEKTDDAENAYMKSISLFRDIGETCRDELADSFDAIFELYEFDMNQKVKADESCKEMFSIRTDLYNRDQQRYAVDYCGALQSYGLLCGRRNRVKECEKVWGNRVDIASALMRDNPVKRESMFASALMDYGKILHWTHNYDEAMKYYVEALGHYRNLAKDAPDRYEPSVASLLEKIGLLNRWRNNQKASLDAYCECVAIYRKFSLAYPGKFTACLAESLEEYADVLDDVNRITEAQKCLEEAIALFRTLVRKNPVRYEGKLVTCLKVLGNVYKANNSIEEAGQALVECVEIAKSRCEKSGNKHDMCLPLLSLANFHKDVNRLQESETEFKEALALARDLANDNPNVYEPWVAHIASSYGDLVETIGDAVVAERLYNEALTISRKFQINNPERFDADVADSLIDLAVLHKTYNRLSESEVEYKEVLEIHRRLAKENPAKFEASVAGTLSSMGDLYEDLNKLAEAEKMYTESLEIRCRLAKENPAKYDSAVASSLTDLASLHKSTNRLVDSEREYAEALEIRRRLAKDNPAKFEASVASTLSSMGDLYDDLNKLAEAEKMYTESLEIRRRLAKENPAKYDSAVASSLTDLASLHKSTNRLVDSEREYAEALEIRRRLAKDNPAKFESTVAVSLHGIGMLKRDVDKPKESETAFAEAVGIYRRLANENHDKFDSSLANTLVEYAQLHRDNNKMEQADSEYAESIILRRKLAESNPDKFNGPVSETLTGMGVLHTLQDKLDWATQEFGEALQLREELAAVNPDKFNEKLAETLHEQAKLLIKKGDMTGARVNLKRACKIRNGLVAISAEKFTEKLKETSTLLSMIADD